MIYFSHSLSIQTDKLNKDIQQKENKNNIVLINKYVSPCIRYYNLLLTVSKSRLAIMWACKKE